MLKINKIKNIIVIHFKIKNILNCNYNHTSKHRNCQQHHSVRMTTNY